MLKRAFVLGINHKTAPLPLREKLAATEETTLRPALKQAGMEESFVLSTCNRYEIYGVVPCVKARPGADFLAKLAAIPSEELAGAVYLKTGREMVRHGFEVAASLDSMVLGEPQILGQLKKAYEAGRQSGTVKTFLDRYCAAALRAGKTIRSQTAIGTEKTSVAAVGVAEATHVLGNLTGKTALIIGVGDMGLAAARHLQNSGIGELLLTARRRETAQAAAEKLEATAIAPDKRPEALRKADLIITCAASHEFLLTAADLAPLTQNRSTPLMVLDIALPRNVAPDAADLPGLTLIDLDHLEGLCERARRHRLEEIGRAQLILEEEVSAFVNWTEERKNTHIVKYLRENIERVREEVIGRHSSPEAIRATRLLVNKLLHHPSAALRRGDLPADEVARVLEALFPSGCTRRPGGPEN